MVPGYGISACDKLHQLFLGIIPQGPERFNIELTPPSPSEWELGKEVFSLPLYVSILLTMGQFFCYVLLLLYIFILLIFESLMLKLQLKIFNFAT